MSLDPYPLPIPLSDALAHFEDAVRAHETVGSLNPEDRVSVQNDYEITRDTLIDVLCDFINTPKVQNTRGPIAERFFRQHEREIDVGGAMICTGGIKRCEDCRCGLPDDWRKQDADVIRARLLHTQLGEQMIERDEED
jgi:hypothetical protein